MTGGPPPALHPPLLRRVARAVGLAALVLGPLAGTAVVLALQVPSWWRPGSRADVAAGERAAAFEQSIVSAFTRVRADEPEWTLRIQASEVNDWLATRLPAWLESRGEPVPEAVQARMQPGLVTVGVDLRNAVAWWRANPVAREGGVLLSGAGGGVGRLPVPFVGVGLESRWQAAGLERPIRLADGRLVRVIEVQATDGEVRMRLRTDPRPVSESRP